MDGECPHVYTYRGGDQRQQGRRPETRDASEGGREGYGMVSVCVRKLKGNGCVYLYGGCERVAAM